MDMYKTKTIQSALYNTTKTFNKMFHSVILKEPQMILFCVFKKKR